MDSDSADPIDLVRSQTLTVLLRPPDADGQVVVELAGEADISCSGIIGGVLRRVAAGSPPSVVLDLGRLQFMDSTGLQFLIRGHTMLVQAGAAVEVRHVRPAVRRVMELIAVDELLGLTD